LGEHRNPYVAVVAVWIGSAFGLASVISLPISAVLFYGALLFLVITVIGGLAYRAYRTDLENRDLPKKLFSDLRRFIVNVFEDFGIVSVRASAWWLRREAHIREDMAQEQESKARRKERMIELERKRRERPAERYLTIGEHEAYKEVLKNQPNAERRDRQGLL
jgi:hypothetical protein